MTNATGRATVSLFCGGCGTALRESAAFCPRCGARRDVEPYAYASEQAAPPQDLDSTMTGSQQALPTPAPRWGVVAQERAVPATFGQRLGARLIDGVVVAVPALLLYGTLAGLVAHVSSDSGLVGGLIGILVAWCGASAASLVYFQSCERVSGRTVGRAAVGIRLVRLRSDGLAAPAVGGWRALARRVVSGLGECIFLLGSLSVLWDSEHRSWGDRATGTAVIQSRQGRGPARAVWLGALVTALFAGALVLVVVLPDHSGGSNEGDLSPASLPSTAPNPAVPAAAPAPYVTTWTIDESAGDSATGQVSFEVGAATPYEAGAVNGRDVLGSSCSGSAATDAMVPFRLTTTNTGRGSDLLGINFGGIGTSSIPDIVGPRVDLEVVYSEGAECKGTPSGDSGFGVQAELAPAGRATTYGYFIVRNMYGSDKGGAGTAAILSDARLTINSSQTLGADGATTALSIQSVQGVGVLTTSSGWSVPLGGQ